MEQLKLVLKIEASVSLPTPPLPPHCLHPCLHLPSRLQTLLPWGPKRADTVIVTVLTRKAWVRAEHLGFLFLISLNFFLINLFLLFLVLEIELRTLCLTGRCLARSYFIVHDGLKLTM